MDIDGGYILCTAPCFCCSRIFTFNPMKVPSLRDSSGVRQPICLLCIQAANVKRKQNGLAPHIPDPEAYEACRESECSWGD